MIINISNKTAFVLLVIIAATLIVFVSNAYVYSSYTLDPGHTADKVLVDIPSTAPGTNLGEKDLQQAVIDQNLGKTGAKPTITQSTYSDGQSGGSLGIHDACFLQSIIEDKDTELTKCAVTGTPGGTWSISKLAADTCKVMCLDWP